MRSTTYICIALINQVTPHTIGCPQRYTGSALVAMIKQSEEGNTCKALPQVFDGALPLVRPQRAAKRSQHVFSCVVTGQVQQWPAIPSVEAGHSHGARG